MSVCWLVGSLDSGFEAPPEDIDDVFPVCILQKGLTIKCLDHQRVESNASEQLVTAIDLD
jgi:hypothetical protein